MTWALVALPPPFLALVGRQNCTFLAVALVKLLARVSGVSPWSTETPSGPRTKRLDRLERLDSDLCGRRGAAGRTSLLSDVRNDVVTLGLRYPYILILSPISALMSATISVYPDIVVYISSDVSYDIRDVPDIVGGKNRASLKIGPDIEV